MVEMAIRGSQVRHARRARKRRVAAALVGAVLALGISGHPALGAQPGAGSGDAPSSGGECTSAAECVAEVRSSDEPGGDEGTGVSPCVHIVGEHHVVTAHLEAFVFSVPLTPGADSGPPAGTPDRTWVMTYCPGSPGSGLELASILPLGEPPDAATVVRIARGAVRIPLPRPGFAPPSDAFQVVGVETWMWLDAEGARPLVRSACIPPGDHACVEVTATLVDFVAEMGDGSDAIICEGPGTPYDPALDGSRSPRPHCGHVYTTTPTDGPAYQVRVRARWAVSYTCRYDSDLDGSRDASCGEASLGIIARASPPQPLEVRDLQAVAFR